MPSSPHIIRPLEERYIATKVDLMVWSSKMDLVALSNYNGEIALHRLTWQRVWLLPPLSSDMYVRKMAWRPDGKVLAVAYVPRILKVGKPILGEIVLINVENKEPLSSITVSDDVSCLVWLQEKQVQEHHQNLSGSFHHQDGTSDFLPKLPCLSRVFASMPDNHEESHDDSKRVKDQSQLNFLLIGTCDGNLYLSVFGLFSCGVTNIERYMDGDDDDKHKTVIDADLSHDMKSLFLMVAVDIEKFYAETVKDEDETGRIDNRQKQRMLRNQELSKHRVLRLVILDTSVLSSRSRELYALSQKQGHIISLMDYLSQTMRSIIEAWENIYLLEIDSKLSRHAESLPESSLSADLLELLLIGVPSDSLGEFLVNEVNDVAIKKLGHSIELSHSNIQKLILKHLLSVGQNLAYHLAEMKGMAKLTDRFKVLGLEEEAVAEAFNAAGAFLIKSTEVQLVIDESMKRYKAFFRWLYAIILRFTDERIPELTLSEISQQDLDFIAEYLQKLDIKTDDDGITKRHCFLDRLGQYLANRDLTTPSESEKDNQWQKLLAINPCLQNHSGFIKRCKNTSLVQQHEDLKRALLKVFRTPNYAIGNMFERRRYIIVTNTPSKSITMCCIDDITIFISFIELKSPFEFPFFRISERGDTCEVQSRVVSFRSEKRVVMRCLDLQFYRPEILSVLFEEQDGNNTAVLAQLSTDSIFDNVTHIFDSEILTDPIVMVQIPGFVASSFAVSGTRKVAIILSAGQRKVRLYEMEAEDDDEDEEMNTVSSNGDQNKESQDCEMVENNDTNRTSSETSSSCSECSSTSGSECIECSIAEVDCM